MDWASLSKADYWAKIWINILKKNGKYLDLSSVELDGSGSPPSHTPAKNGGDAVVVAFYGILSHFLRKINKINNFKNKRRYSIIFTKKIKKGDHFNGLPF